ncbi:MAG: PAS domain-containing protein [Nitrospirae bacterium]|nr:PAS domain-containing protein [Nitrospirota bacterium]
MGIIHPDDLTLAIETFQQVLRGETPLPYELRVLSRHGEYLVGGFVSTPQIRDGKIVGEFGIVCDITEHKHAEDKIRTLSELNDKIIRTSPIGIHVIDRDFIVRIWNSYLETYTTIEARDIIGKNLFEVIHGLVSSGWDKEYRRVIESGEPLERYGYKHIRTMGPKKGEVLYQNTKIVPLKQNGNVIGAITILEDITTYKKTEKELTEKVEELEKFYEMAIGREIKMKELKEEIERLKAELSEYKKT